MSGQAHGEFLKVRRTQLPACVVCKLLVSAVSLMEPRPAELGTQAGRARNPGLLMIWSLGPAQGHDSTGSCRGVRVVDKKTSLIKVKGLLFAKTVFPGSLPFSVVFVTGAVRVSA